MENLQKKYADETEEDKQKRKKQQLLPAFVYLGISVAMLILGVKHNNDEDCPAGDNAATRFLTVGGAVLLVSSALKILAYVTPCECDDKIAEVLGPLLDMAYFIVIIWGSVLVFGKFLNFLAFSLRPRFVNDFYKHGSLRSHKCLQTYASLA